MKNKKILFWQPKTDILRLVLKLKSGKYFLAITNYLIWIFLFYISYILIRKEINIFWQLLTATILAEIVERLMKKKIYWQRPLFTRKDETPPGLVDCWYKTGSFPSGHTIKTVFFFLFLLQYQIFSPAIFLLITIPLLIFRVVIGFHYPIDMIGGFLIGIIVWFLTNWITMPDIFNNFVQPIFNFVFFIH